MSQLPTVPDWFRRRGELAAWIDEPRRHLDAGELANLPPLDLGNALTLSHVELAVRRMLSDVEMFRAMDPAERALPHFRARRRTMLVGRPSTTVRE